MKLDEEARALIGNLIGNDVCVTQLNLKKKLLEQLNIDVSVTISINKVIITLNFTFKRNTQQKYRQEFREKIQLL